MTNIGQERELGWDDIIENDGDDFITLVPGEYEFTVEKIERARFMGSDNMPACSQANIFIRIIDPLTNKVVSIKTRLLLHSRTEWTIAAFFRSIGLRKKGDKLPMKWEEAPGQTGKCKITHRLYKDQTYNEVDKFLPADEESNQTSIVSPATTFQF